MTTRVVYRDGSSALVDPLPVAFLDVEEETGKNVVAAFATDLKVHFSVLHRTLTIAGGETRGFREWIESVARIEDVPDGSDSEEAREDGEGEVPTGGDPGR